MAGHDWSRSNNWKLHQIYQYIFDVIETFSLSYHVNRSKHNYRGLTKKALHEERLFGEATTGFEPVMRVLQTLALPLGHVAKELQIEDQGFRKKMLTEIPISTHHR